MIAFGKNYCYKDWKQNLSTNKYGANNGALKSITYGNGDTRAYTYNVFGSVSTQTVNNIAAYKWGYTTAGRNVSHTDLINKLKYSYEYDSIGRRQGSMYIIPVIQSLLIPMNTVMI